MDIFINAVGLNLLNNYNLPIFIKTSEASTSAGFFRIVLTPIDILKTMKQEEGGTENYKNKK